MFCPIWTSLDMFAQLSGRKRFLIASLRNDPNDMKVDDDDDLHQPISQISLNIANSKNSENESERI